MLQTKSQFSRSDPNWTEIMASKRASRLLFALNIEVVPANTLMLKQVSKEEMRFCSSFLYLSLYYIYYLLVNIRSSKEFGLYSINPNDCDANKKK